MGSPLNYTDPSGNKIFKDLWDSFWNWITGANDPVAEEVIGIPLTSTPSPAPTEIPNAMQNGNSVSPSPDGYLNQQVENAQENRNNQECVDENLQDAYHILEQYLEGLMSEDDTYEALNKIYCAIGGLKEYKNERVDEEGKKEYYSTDNRDYERYDCFIVGWTWYFNHISKYEIDPEIIKGIMYTETKMGYYQENPPSPNANATKDVMQVLDPRNSAIYDYAEFQPEKGVYIYNENYEMVINTDVSSKYTFTTSGRNLYEGVAKILFDERENRYYYRHDNATPNLSVALGVKHYYLALEIANNDIDKAIRLYTLGHFEKDPDKLKGKMIMLMKF